MPRAPLGAGEPEKDGGAQPLVGPLAARERCAGLTDAVGAERQRLERIVVAVLKAIREDLDISRAELADRLGWKPEQIAELEIGRRIVRPADLILIARALKIAPDVLLRRIVPMD